jgi:putative redox protein
MSEPKPPVVVDVAWKGELLFEAKVGGLSLLVDSAGVAGASPVQTLAVAVATCMAMDLAHILKKGRFDPKAIRGRLEARRAPTDPHRIVAARLHFEVTGEVPPEKVERAIALSRDTYCSVWHSMRQDIDFVTSFEVKAA